MLAVVHFPQVLMAGAVAGFYLPHPSWKKTLNGILTEEEMGLLDTGTIMVGVLEDPLMESFMANIGAGLGRVKSCRRHQSQF